MKDPKKKTQQEKKKTDLQGFVRLHMLKHIPGMRRMASEWQERPCICRSISWPSCRLASYLLNETVPTDLDNRTLASAPRSLALRALLYHRDSLCQREAAQTALDPAVGGYAEPHNRQLQMLPLLLLQCSWRFFFLSLSRSLPLSSYHGYDSNTGLWVIHPRIQIQFTLSHISPGWMCGCDPHSRWFIPSQSYHVTSRAMRRAEMHPAALTHDCNGLVLALTLSQNW